MDHNTQKNLALIHSINVTELCDELPGSVYLLDNDCKIIWCNKQQYKMLESTCLGELVGKDIFDISRALNWEKGIAENIHKNDLSVLTGKSILCEETVLLGGENKIFLSKKSPLKGKNNNIIGIIGFSIDITTKKHAERLEKAIIEKTNKHLKTITGSIAHELRNPLAGIRASAALIQAFINKFAKQVVPIEALQISKLCGNVNEHTASIERSTKKSLKYITTQLTNIKNDDKNNLADFTQCSMTKIVEEALTDYPFENKQQRALVHWQGGQDFTFHGHPQLSYHILSNFLNNALHYIEHARKGEITIWLESDAHFNFLHFKDTAAGIPSKIVAKIFEPFYSTREHGTGLGLAFCQDLVHASGGKISCVAEEGKYTQFTVCLPKEK